MIALPSNRKVVYNVYGIDPLGNPLSMFFRTAADAIEFMDDLPGSYDVMTLDGIGYDSFEIGVNLSGDSFRHEHTVTRLDIRDYRA